MSPMDVTLKAGVRLPSLRSRTDETTNTGFFAQYLENEANVSKNNNKKNTEHCLIHLNKTACEIRSVFDKDCF